MKEKNRYLRHILIEEETSEKDGQFFEKLVTDCSDIIDFYLSMSKSLKYLFHRGIKGQTVNGYFKYPENRQPKDSSVSFHNFLNNYFKRKGFNTNRSNSVFVNSSTPVASGYGRLHMFFPENGFNFLWSPKVNDAYENNIFFTELDPIKKILKSIKYFKSLFPESFFYKEYMFDIQNYIVKELYNIDFIFVSSGSKRIYDNLFEKTKNRSDINIISSSVITNGSNFRYKLFEILPFLKEREVLKIEEKDVKEISDAINSTINSHFKEIGSTSNNIKRSSYIREKILDTLCLYLAFSSISEYFGKIHKVKLSDLKHVDYKENKNLLSAFESQNEVMFSGTNDSGYYLLDYSDHNISMLLQTIYKGKGNEKE